MKIWITGAAGFIGSYTADRCLREGHQVTGIDCINDYYDVQLKEMRLAELVSKYPSFSFHRMQLENASEIMALMENTKPDVVIHLAAQAGVRYSLINPHAYIQSNVVATVNMLEACRTHEVKHLLYASSSSVYGANKKVPFSVEDRVDRPVSLYAATKKSNELMAYTYSHLYDLPTTGLRFFTVYGPCGRPDMAYFSFAERMMSGQPIDVFNNGEMMRDFTYIDDIVEGIMRLVPKAPVRDGEEPPYRVYNIGNNQPVKLMTFIRLLEQNLGVQANIRMKEMQPGDVEVTYADIDALQRDIDYRPVTSIEEGLRKFCEWYIPYREARERGTEQSSVSVAEVMGYAGK
ncbi:GDP-mannose 4,6-dehydratase [Paenibacillus sp. ACRRX]|uniref:NAD-dependent epimerase/dehydratase family protein n=1 Tax=unclassified Paenibacillus TaxID=185978 RepID=UPI001EF68F6D|nr:MULTISPECIES: NAD-dependent epimerase/dehydratase family protein [unclassified Paenibacillus]MCG7408995.1 GDP-mannose 4,6-dehydratase [Paenibacillus sp. ACRRX]MDK8182006.1 GDP-mannose 4,6-dehydratase [Paenibacillus sp. UMB4589-SE434]